MRPGNNPAFPIVTPDMPVEGSPGLTKRELLAAMAMQGYLAMYAGPDIAAPTANAVAQASVDYADALLAELAK
jgi:hypothetical protein